MAKKPTPPKFTESEWKEIRKKLTASPDRYGLPRRVYGSLVLGSFNIRKLGPIRSGGKHERDMNVWQFLADVCKHFDLLAVQELLETTEGIEKLTELMGDDFGLLYSDTTGAFPGRSGMLERMAFIYNRTVIQPTEMVTSITYDRNEIVRRIGDHNDQLHQALTAYAADRAKYNENLKRFSAGTLGSKPKEPSIPELPNFVTFQRTPFAAGFQVQGYPGSERYEFLAVNAHLTFAEGDEAQRQWEAEAMLEWIMGKIKENRSGNLNAVMFGDLNLDFDDPAEDLPRIAAKVRHLNKTLGGSKSRQKKEVILSFPFVFPHPNLPADSVYPKGKVLRTNVRLDQTYDQIGLFSLDSRLKGRLETKPEGLAKGVWGVAERGPDYGVFNFSQLFSEALKKKKVEDLGKDKSHFIGRYDNRVSDHMPLWMRIPLPDIPGRSYI